MSYTATWTNGAAGRVQAFQDYVRLCDATELAAAINRRLMLVGREANDYSASFCQGAFVRGRAAGRRNVAAV